MSSENIQFTFSVVFLNQNQLSDAKIEQMARWGQRFHELGVAQAAEGNMSYHSTLGFVISGTGVPLETIGKETVAEVTGVVFGMAGTAIYVKGPVTPSSESLLHNAIYEEDEDVNVIFHLHDRPVMEKAAKLGIPVTETEQKAGTLELAKEAVKLMKANKGLRYFILKNHGVVALGANTDEVGKLAEEMHANATGRK